MKKSQQLLNSQEPLAMTSEPLNSEEARTLRWCFQNGVKLSFAMLSDKGRLHYEAPIKEMWEEDGRLFVSYSIVEGLEVRKTSLV